MKVNSPNRSRKFSRRNTLSPPLIVAVTLVVMLTGGALWGSYQLGIEAGASIAAEGVDAASLRLELNSDASYSDIHLNAGAQMDAMALRLGDMQADLLRMEALGEELVKAGNLDPEEFNFNEPPPRGGLDSTAESVPVDLPDLLVEVELLARSIADRTHKLELMKGLIVGSKIQQSLEPEGRPVENGWISSEYGYRQDPFNGKKTFHHGVDIASKRNSQVFAVASGVVMDAVKKSGYGYYIEINHADGLVTKYAHNSKIFVEPGDLVEKGDVIGLVGSSGRSTGPHVHFEIARNGKSINPAAYIE
ncbi:MAG: M23 family metallopeptidase [Chromatiaceae bacterium]|nr:M23 family metallopeptidase [Chromatiaceae bacterium]